MKIMDETVYVFHAPGEEETCFETQNYCYIVESDRTLGGAKRVFHGNFQYNQEAKAVQDGVIFQGQEWILLEEITTSILLNDEEFMSLSDENAMKRYCLAWDKTEPQEQPLSKRSLGQKLLSVAVRLIGMAVMIFLMTITSGLIIPVIIAFIVYFLWKKGSFK